MLTEATFSRPYLAALEPSVCLSSLLVPAWHHLLHCTNQPSLFNIGHNMTSAVHACLTEMHNMTSAVHACLTQMHNMTSAVHACLTEMHTHLSVVCKAFSFALSGDSAAACTFRFPLHKQQSVCTEPLMIHFGLH